MLWGQGLKTDNKLKCSANGHTSALYVISRMFLDFCPQIIYEICSGHEYSKNKVRGQGHKEQLDLLKFQNRHSEVLNSAHNVCVN